MSYQSVIVGGYLCGIDVASFQAADVSSKTVVEESHVWRAIIKREMPQFVVDDEIWSDSRQWPLIVKCFGSLSRAILSRTCIVKVSKASDLECLDVCLRRSAKTRSSHIDKGGLAAYVLVGDFIFNRDGPSPRFPFRAGEAPRGLPAGELEMKVYVNSEASIMLGAKYYALGGRLAEVDAAVSFTTNLASVESRTKVSFQGGHLSINGSEQVALKGLCRHSPDDEASRVTASSLCVMSLTDGHPQGPSQLAAALNIDVGVKRYPRAHSISAHML
eukprot:TRINITY_DN8509_c0_g1_i3.p1 TRINITY_DN8509_c0_g1~~TRINITY_DN8509_c0_g1_i3.p1  ORF type:complete len:274 (+),score=27.33 TRINITY_DN8509_c0_g1_i3:58-879(+)